MPRHPPMHERELPTQLLWLGLALLCVVCCAVAVPARADDRAQAQREAKQAFERGLTLARAGNFEAAVVAFERSRSLVERPSVLQNLAVALEHLGQYGRALACAERGLALLPPSHPSVPQLTSIRERLRAHQARLVVRAEPGDAQVWIDEQLVTATNEPRWLDPGEHALRVAKAGYVDTSRVLFLTAGEEHVAEVRLEPIVSAREITLNTVNPSAPAPSTAQGRKLAPWAYASLGTSVLLGAAGTTLYVLAGREQRTWRHRCPDYTCSDGSLAAAEARIDRLDFAAYASLATAGALLVTAGVLGFLQHGESQSAARLSLGPSGVSVAGRF